MEDPTKIIFKYKNNNHRIQYQIYIFIGEVEDKIFKILKNIQDKTLLDSLLSLNKNDYQLMETRYGIFWYKKFFNTYHINGIINTIKKNTQQKNDLIDKYGQEWFDKHINLYQLIEKKIYYSYEALIKDEILRKESRKKRLRAKEEDEQFDYTTARKEHIDTILTKAELSREKKKISDSNKMEYLDTATTTNLTRELFDYEFFQSGGQYEYTEEADENNDGTVEFEEGLENDDLLQDEAMDMDEVDLEEIEKIYQEMDVVPDDNILQTTNLIKMALKDEDFIKKTKSELLDFDQSKDNLMYDENLRNVFFKNYVTSQYIFKDDTIKMIKNKICCSIKNNSKFEPEPFIIPSRQYLWSEYYYNEKIEKIMVGQKWIVRSDLLKIDVEPNINLRYYEELRGSLKLLRDNIKRYGSKIKWEDDDFNILYDYENYYTNNEIYLLDIYNELSLNYNPDSESLKNLMDVYIKIYFPRIKSDDIKYIIDYLNGETKVESSKTSSIYEIINNDLILENQIMYDVETVKTFPEYRNLFKENYITQSTIHVNLRLFERTRIDLFRIFNEFVVNEQYPFIQYQTPDGQIIFKYSEENILEFGKNKDNIVVLSKWFENAPYGISFKVKIIEKDREKFMAINLNETGRIEYKTQWKEEDMATIDDIRKTYEYVKDLIRKINSEKSKMIISIPDDNEFKYAFINSIQKFILPEKFIINHNDLSEFSRYFFPYVALVIEPRKRQAKIKKDTEKSKFGTYLRYKRVSKYENQARIEQRILYFMRNYDYNDQSLSNEISKQFNITLDRAMEAIERVRNRYPNIKRSRKLLKKLENIPKYKPPGIGIDIQGKHREKYKIRISGARNKDQLNRIITFMNILIHLYVETYLYKKPERQILKDKLKKLSNIARRRNRVDEVVNYDREVKTIKQMAQLDKKRIGFKPEKGQNQWTRSCQNSGTDKKRRPQQSLSPDELAAQGFKLDKKNNIFEKKINIKGRSGKTKEILIRAVGLKGTDDEGKDLGTIYYSCNPDENGEHMFVGFLSRSNNPYGQCMPCCFKKDPFISKNKSKRDYYLKCIGQIEDVTEKQKGKIIGDQLYILQDTNKIQEGRFGFLPKYLDFFLNQSMGKVRRIKQHYLLSSQTGYFFKFGSKQDDYPFFNAISSIYDKTTDQIKNILVSKLENDKNNLLFTAINNGDIKTTFGTKNKFIDYIKLSTQLTFELFNHFLSLPGILSEFGSNIIVFEKRTITIKKTLEKEKIREDFTIICQNSEEINNINDTKRETILLVKEIKNFYPIVLVIKDDESSKSVDIIKKFKYKNDNENIIFHIADFYLKNCEENIFNDINNKKNNISAKNMFSILNALSNKNFNPKFQIIDARNKTKYIITNNSTIIPVKPSGSIFDLQILKNIQTKLLPPKETINNLNELHKLVKEELPIKPIGLYYLDKNKDSAKIISIMTQSYDNVPVIEENLPISWINKQGLVLDFRQLYDKIDQEISQGKSNYLIDERIKEVNINQFNNESYELFRLEISDFINKIQNDAILNKIQKIINSDLSKSEIKNQLKNVLYKLIDKDLLKLFEEQENQKNQNDNNQMGGKTDKFIYVSNKIPDITDYEIRNIRETCATNDTKDKCSFNLHCHWNHDTCQLSLTKNMIITFINKLSEELANNDFKASEILKRGDYFVSDVVDYGKFTERQGQKIIKSTSTSINKVLADIFGKEFIPKIGKRRGLYQEELDYEEMNINNPLKDMGSIYIQKVIDNNLTLYRAYANGYSWVKHKFYDLDSRNLGYYSLVQTDLANYFRSLVIDWINDNNNYDEIQNKLIIYTDINSDKYLIRNLVNKLMGDISITTNGIIEYHILSKNYNITIIVYDDNNNILYIFDNGLIYDHNKKNNKIDNKYNNSELLRNCIHIKFTLMGNSDIPIDIEVLYYK
ncbi:VETF early transcription factor large subunit [uncultured virus]|nr:VETF early transcription factor large subunit [uncultured virus]